MGQEENKTDFPLGILILSIINVVVLSLSHNYRITVLVIAALGFFCLCLLLVNTRLVLPLMLFYLPWATILKMAPGSFSLFSLVCVALLGLMVIRLKKNLNLNALVAGLLLVSFLVLLNISRVEAFQTSQARFVIVLLMLTVYMSVEDNYPDFRTSALFYASGIITACIMAYFLLSSSAMQQFIVVTEYRNINVTRLAGFNNDPNYFSAQVMMAVACLLILVNNTGSLFRKIILFAMIGTLLFFGLTSVSKMFLFSIVAMIMIWIFTTFAARRNLSHKISVIVLTLLLLSVATSSQLFSGIIDEYLARFYQISDINTLTTGRSQLQSIYVSYISSHPDVLLFGVGLTEKFAPGSNNNVHNTFIEFIYKLGLTGTLLFWLWYAGVYRQSVSPVKMSFQNRLQFLIPLLALVMPWFALDMISGDEFCYNLVLIIVAINYLKSLESPQMTMPVSQTLD